eukprot:jgi/Bigna1/72282/fgenesh1_pg.19_\
MGDSGTIQVHAWVSEVYNVVVDAAMHGKVQDLIHQIEDMFSEGLQLDFKILALQDPNHNDLPPTCKVNLVLKSVTPVSDSCDPFTCAKFQGDKIELLLLCLNGLNLDKVFVVVHPNSLHVPAAQSFRKRRRRRRLFTHAFGEKNNENNLSESKKRSSGSQDVAACFTNYFKLREMLSRPRSVTTLIKSFRQSQNRSNKAKFIEDQLILTRIRIISEELEDKHSDGESSSQGLSEIVDRLPHGFEYMLCRSLLWRQNFEFRNVKRLFITQAFKSSYRCAETNGLNFDVAMKN